MSNSEVYGVIWDVDGTMVDTAELHFQAWTALTGELNIPFSRAVFIDTFGRRNPEIIRERLGRDYTDQEVADLGKRKEELYRARARQGVALLPGVRKLLEDLHNAGFRQAIGSSAPRANLDLILEMTRTEGLFDAIVSMEDTQRGKPDPQVFQVAAARLQMPPERCLVVEDAPAGVEAAKTAGMKCLAVSNAGHHPDAKLLAAGADLLVHSLEEVDLDRVRQLLRRNFAASAQPPTAASADSRHKA
jgi:beta-phosphoglucomutase